MRNVRGITKLFCLLSSISLIDVSAQEAQITSLSENLFSKAQITEGRQVFSGFCIQCHSARQTSELTYSRWHGKKLGKLFNYVSESMPPERRVSYNLNNILM